MFFSAHEKFEQGLYLESLELFRNSAHEDDARVQYWSHIYIARCLINLSSDGAIEHLRIAHETMPWRAEALHEIGKWYYESGDLLNAEKFLQMAKDCDKNVNCIRYEADKYFERNHELLIDIYVRLSRYNDAEELLYTLTRLGNAKFYDVQKIKYNELFARHYNNTFIEFVKSKAVCAKEDLVIQLPKGYDGLGDQLVFSHIPEIAKKTGRYKRVFISELNAYGRPEYRDLIWKMNPFIDGFTEEPGTFTDLVQFGRVLEKWIDPMPGINLMDSMMLMHDIDDGKRGHFPVCYYAKRERSDLSWIRDKTVVDIGSRTISTKDFDREAFLGVLEKNNCKPDAFIVAKGLTNSMEMESETQITPVDIYDWCDVIMNCGNYVCFNSGGYWLSAALGVKGTQIWIKEKNLPAWSYLWHTNIHTSLHEVMRK